MAFEMVPKMVWTHEVCAHISDFMAEVIGTTPLPKLRLTITEDVGLSIGLLGGSDEDAQNVGVWVGTTAAKYMRPEFCKTCKSFAESFERASQIPGAFKGEVEP